MQYQRRKLGEVAEVIAGLSGLDTKGEYKYNVVQPNNLTEDGQVTGAIVLNRSEPLPQKQLLVPGDILIKRLNPSYVFQVKTPTANLSFSQNMFAIRPKDGMDSNYLAFLLEQQDVLGEIMHVTGKASVVKAISAKMLNDVEIPVPSTEKQQTIGKTWELLRRRKRLLQEYLQENEEIEKYLAKKILNDGGAD